MTATTRRFPVLLLATVCLPAGTLAAQETPAPEEREPGRLLIGVLDRGSSDPVPGVAVRLLTLEGEEALTDGDGRATVDAVPPGVHEIQLRHIAYGTRSQLVNVPPGRTVEVEIRLTPRVIGLEPLEVEVTIRAPGLEREGYYRRERLGFGTYFGPEEVDRKTFTGMLYEVPSLRLGRGRSAFRHYPYFQRGFRACAPTLVVDGRWIRLRGMAVEDMVDRNIILAMEVYRPHDTPGEFQYRFHRDCGAIVIWTKRQGR